MESNEAGSRPSKIVRQQTRPFQGMPVGVPDSSSKENEKKILPGRRQQRHSTEIGAEYHRWWAVRNAVGFETNEHIAGLLLDGFHALLEQIVCICGYPAYKSAQTQSGKNKPLDDVNIEISPSSATTPAGNEEDEEIKEYKNAITFYCDTLWKMCGQQDSRLQELDKLSQTMQDFIIRLMGYLKVAKGRSYSFNYKKKKFKPTVSSNSTGPSTSVKQPELNPQSSGVFYNPSLGIGHCSAQGSVYIPTTNHIGLSSCIPNSHIYQTWLHNRLSHAPRLGAFSVTSAPDSSSVLQKSSSSNVFRENPSYNSYNLEKLNTAKNELLRNSSFSAAFDESDGKTNPSHCYYGSQTEYNKQEDQVNPLQASECLTVTQKNKISDVPNQSDDNAHRNDGQSLNPHGTCPETGTRELGVQGAMFSTYRRLIEHKSGCDEGPLKSLLQKPVSLNPYSQTNFLDNRLSAETAGDKDEKLPGVLEKDILKLASDISVKLQSGAHTSNQLPPGAETPNVGTNSKGTNTCYWSDVTPSDLNTRDTAKGVEFFKQKRDKKEVTDKTPKIPHQGLPKPMIPAIYQHRDSGQPASLGTQFGHPVIFYPAQTLHSKDTSLASLSSLVQNIVYNSYGTVLKPLSLGPGQASITPGVTQVSQTQGSKTTSTATSVPVPILSSHVNTRKQILHPLYISPGGIGTLRLAKPDGKCILTHNGGMNDNTSAGKDSSPDNRVYSHHHSKLNNLDGGGEINATRQCLENCDTDKAKREQKPFEEERHETDCYPHSLKSHELANESFQPNTDNSYNELAGPRTESEKLSPKTDNTCTLIDQSNCHDSEVTLPHHIKQADTIASLKSAFQINTTQRATQSTHCDKLELEECAVTKQSTASRDRSKRGSQSRRLVCSLCQIIFFSGTDLLVHRYEHHSHVCTECDGRFLSKARLEQHKASDHPEIMVCQHCRFHTFSKPAMSEHLQEVHNVSEDSANKQHSKSDLMLKETSKPGEREDTGVTVSEVEKFALSDLTKKDKQNSTSDPASTQPKDVAQPIDGERPTGFVDDKMVKTHPNGTAPSDSKKFEESNESITQSHSVVPMPPERYLGSTVSNVFQSMVELSKSKYCDGLKAFNGVTPTAGIIEADENFLDFDEQPCLVIDTGEEQQNEIEGDKDDIEDWQSNGPDRHGDMGDKIDHDQPLCLVVHNRLNSGAGDVRSLNRGKVDLQLEKFNNSFDSVTCEHHGGHLEKVVPPACQQNSGIDSSCNKIEYLQTKFSGEIHLGIGSNDDVGVFESPEKYETKKKLVMKISLKRAADGSPSGEVVMKKGKKKGKKKKPKVSDPNSRSLADNAEELLKVNNNLTLQLKPTPNSPCMEGNEMVGGPRSNIQEQAQKIKLPFSSQHGKDTSHFWAVSEHNMMSSLPPKKRNFRKSLKRVMQTDMSSFKLQEPTRPSIIRVTSCKPDSLGTEFNSKD